MPCLTQERVAALSICLLLAAGSLVYNALPVLLDAVADRLSLGEDRVGYLGSSYLAGQTLLNLGGLYWLRRLAWKTVLRVSLLVMVVSLALCAFAGYPALMVLFFVAGSACGAILGIVFCLMGTAKDPKMIYGLGILTHMGYSGIIVEIATGSVLPAWGTHGLFALMAVAYLVFLPVVSGVPGEQTAGSPELSSGTGSRIGPGALSGLVGVLVYFVGQTMIWAFLMRIGGAAGFPEESTGRVIAVVLIASGLAALLPGLLGNRLGTVFPLVLGTGTFVGSMWMLAHGHSIEAFAVAVMVQSSAWNFTVPYQLAAIASRDTRGLYASQIPACQAIGGVMGPAAGGLLAADGDFGNMFLLAGMTAVLSLVLFVTLVARGERRLPGPGAS